MLKAQNVPEESCIYGWTLYNGWFTRDEYGLYNAHFTIRVNGEVWPETMVDFRFPLKHLVEYVTKVQSVFPGDIFTSGTLPFGAGCELKKWIPQGGVIEFEAEGLGVQLPPRDMAHVRLHFCVPRHLLCGQACPWLPLHSR